MESIQTVLILAPHTDDAELGCGGTMARFLEEGKQTRAAFSTLEHLPEGSNLINSKMNFIHP